MSEEQIESIQFSLTGVQLHRLGAVKSEEESGSEETTGEGDGQTTGGAGQTSEVGEQPAEEPADENVSNGGVSGASWMTVELAEGTVLVIDLTELPPEAIPTDGSADDAGLEIAAGELPQGIYRNVRLLGEATITFTEDLTMGSAEYVAGEPYPLEIPSSESSGVKVQTPKFCIGGDGTAAVTIVFDGSASIKKIKLKPGGARMVPVMRADVVVGTSEPPESPAP